MNFSQVSMSFSDFLGQLEDRFGVDRETFPDAKSEALALESMAVYNLIPRTDKHPSIYVFMDSECKKHLLSRGSTENDTKLFLLDDSTDEEITEHLDMLQKFRGLGVCEWYVLKEYCGQNLGRSSYQTLSEYGLSDCIPTPLDTDTDVTIWVEHNYSDDHKGLMCSGFLMNCEREALVYGNKELAADKIYSLVNSPYTLAVGEQSRPTYTITK